MPMRGKEGDWVAIPAVERQLSERQERLAQVESVGELAGSELEASKMLERCESVGNGDRTSGRERSSR